jgi:transcriptional regulator with XRE-family HTH domain
MSIAEWWQRQRIMQGWTQEEAATKLSIDQTTVSSIERERRLPSIRQLRRMLDLIEASPEERANAWELLAQADAQRSAPQEAA